MRLLAERACVGAAGEGLMGVKVWEAWGIAAQQEEVTVKNSFRS